MESQPPILILMFPRSGSSVVANIFYKHNVWMGRDLGKDRINPNGFFENFKLKRALNEHYGSPHFIHEKQQFPERDEQFDTIVESVLKNEGYPGGLWFFKCNSLYYKPFVQKWPDTKIVCIRRNEESIINSIEKTPLKCRSDLLNLFDLHIEFMEKAVQEQNGVCINYENIVKGYYEELEEAFRYCNLKFDKKKADDVIDSKLQHY